MCTQCTCAHSWAEQTPSQPLCDKERQSLCFHWWRLSSVSEMSNSFYFSNLQIHRSYFKIPTLDCGSCVQMQTTTSGDNIVRIFSELNPGEAAWGWTSARTLADVGTMSRAWRRWKCRLTTDRPEEEKKEEEDESKENLLRHSWLCNENLIHICAQTKSRVKQIYQLQQITSLNI